MFIGYNKGCFSGNRNTIVVYNLGVGDACGDRARQTRSKAAAVPSTGLVLITPNPTPGNLMGEWSRTKTETEMLERRRRQPFRQHICELFSSGISFCFK